MYNRIANKLSLLKKNDLLKNILTLVTGTGISQIIPLAVAPFISRLYTPVNYAILATYTSVTLLLTIISTGMFDSALMLDKKDEHAINTGATAVMITVMTSVISFLTMSIFSGPLVKLAGIENATFWLYAVPITVFSGGFYQTLNIWTIRKQRYKRLAMNRIILTFITSFLTLSLGILHYTEKGLLISLIVGQGFAFLLLLMQTLKNDWSLLTFINRSSIKNAIKRHKDFPKYNLPQSFFDGIKDSSTIWIISFFFGSNILGSFSFAKSMIMRPLQIIGNAANQVFYQRASSTFFQTGSIYKISINTFWLLFASGLPFALMILTLGGEIFNIVFGNKWHQAGLIAQILILFLFLNYITSALSSIPLILNKLKTNLLFGFIFNAMQIVVLFASSYFFNDFKITFWLFTIILSFVLLITLNWYKSLIKTQL